MNTTTADTADTPRIQVINLDHYDGCTTLYDGVLYSVHLAGEVLTVRDLVSRIPVISAKLERDIIHAVYARLCEQVS